MPMNEEEQLEFDRMKTARDSLLITNARLNSKLAERTWVKLTQQDYNEIFAQARNGEHAVQLAEDKLKEKNT